MTVSEIKDNIMRVCVDVRAAAKKAGQDVTVVAATKTVPAELINVLPECGVKIAAENRVQEYVEKRDAVKGLDWHFIGTLQRNKAKYLVGNVSLIQSVSSAALADEISRLAVNRNITQDVLVELNVSGSQDKTGAPMQDANGLIEYVSAKPNLRLCGVMAIPSVGACDDEYKAVARIFNEYKTPTFRILSLGMSGDYERAIGLGSNMVRLGSMLFGSRVR